MDRDIYSRMKKSIYITQYIIWLERFWLMPLSSYICLRSYNQFQAHLQQHLVHHYHNAALSYPSLKALHYMALTYMMLNALLRSILRSIEPCLSAADEIQSAVMHIYI